MRAFTFDVESVDLTTDEMNAFGVLARSACYPDLQRWAAHCLAMISSPQPAGVCDHVVRQVARMWREESRM